MAKGGFDFKKYENPTFDKDDYDEDVDDIIPMVPDENRSANYFFEPKWGN